MCPHSQSVVCQPAPMITEPTAALTRHSPLARTSARRDARVASRSVIARSRPMRSYSARRSNWLGLGSVSPLILSSTPPHSSHVANEKAPVVCVRRRAVWQAGRPTVGHAAWMVFRLYAVRHCGFQCERADLAGRDAQRAIRTLDQIRGRLLLVIRGEPAIGRSGARAASDPGRE